MTVTVTLGPDPSGKPFLQVHEAERAVHLVVWVTASDPASWLPTEQQGRAENRHGDHVREVGQ